MPWMMGAELPAGDAAGMLPPPNTAPCGCVRGAGAMQVKDLLGLCHRLLLRSAACRCKAWPHVLLTDQT
jgi:hypothetical protein